MFGRMCLHLDVKVFFLIWEDSCMLWDIWVDCSSCSRCITVLVSMVTPPPQTGTCRGRRSWEWESRDVGGGAIQSQWQSISQSQKLLEPWPGTYLHNIFKQSAETCIWRNSKLYMSYWVQMSCQMNGQFKLWTLQPWQETILRDYLCCASYSDGTLP